MAGQAKNSDADSVASFFDPDFDKERVWHPEELSAILDHQWRSPLQTDLGGQSAASARRLSLLCDAEHLLVKSYGDVFTHPMPPIELLRIIQQFAQRNLAHPDAELPREIAKLLYVLSIATALTRCGVSITKLSEAEVRQNIASVLAQSWISPDVASILREALGKLGGADGPEQGTNSEGD